MYYVEGTKIFKVSQPLEGIPVSQQPPLPPLANFKNCSTDFAGPNIRSVPPCPVSPWEQDASSVLL